MSGVWKVCLRSGLAIGHATGGVEDQIPEIVFLRPNMLIEMGSMRRYGRVYARGEEACLVSQEFLQSSFISLILLTPPCHMNTAAVFNTLALTEPSYDILRRVYYESYIGPDRMAQGMGGGSGS